MMRKITLILTLLLMTLMTNLGFAQHVFPTITGPSLVTEGTPVTINVNDLGNTAAVPASSTGSYSSFSISVEWSNDDNSWSNEAYLTLITSAGSVLIDPATSGSGSSTASTTLVFEGDFSAAYNPQVDGVLDILLNQSYPGSSANWANIEVTIYESPSCFDPTGLIASNTTVNSVDLTWNDPSGGAQFDFWYVIQPQGTGTGGTLVENYYDPSGGFPLTVTCADESDCANTMLMPNTAYEVYVRADCSGTWVGPVNFNTACGAENIPYSQDFESATTPNLPNCTSQENVGSGNLWTVENNPGYGFTTKALRYGWNSANNADVWFFTNGINLVAGTSYRISYDYGSTGATFPEKLKVAYGTSASAAAMTNALADYPNVVNNTPINDVVDFTPATSGVYYFGFNAYSNADQFYLFVDNIEVDESPSCIDPTTLAASNITASSVDLSWNDPSGSQTDFEYAIQTQGTGTPAGSGVAISATSVAGVAMDINTNPLTPNTAYEAWVRADCGGGDFSEWVGPINFTTSCVAITALPHQEGFDDALMPSCWNTALITGTTNWAPDDTNDGVPSPRTGARFAGKSWSGDNDSALLISPPYNLSAYSTDQVRLNVWVYRSANGIAADRITFFANTSPNVTGATTLVEVPLAISQAPTVPSAGWYNYIVDVPMSFNTIGDFYIIARGVTTSSWSSYSVGFDDYSLELTPSTPPICASNIVATPDASCGNYATVITWDVTPNAEGYYLTIGTSSGNNDVIDNLDLGNVTTYNFTGNHNSTYYYTLVPYNGVGPATGCVEQSFSTNVNGCYCASNPTSVDGQGITNVQIVTTDFPNTINTSPVYNDHTASAVDMSQGINNNVQISFDTGFGYDYNIVIWIDANDDFNLDASEIVYTGLVPNTPIITHDASFVVPVSVPLGQHRMRIVATDGLQTPSNPCYSGTYGETADFTINVILPSCSPVQIASTNLVTNCGTSEFSVDVDVTALGDGSPVISDGTNTWPISTTGIINVGPFAFGSSVTLTALHGSDSVCDLPLGTFTYTACPPSNDECANATILTVGGVFTDNPLVGTNVAATASTGAPAPGCASYSGGDVWFSAEVPASGSLTFELNTQSGGITDGAGAVYSGACGALTLIDCDDSSSSDPEDQPLIQVTGRTPGEVLYFRVWEYGNSEFGEFQVSAYDASMSANAFDSNSFVAYPNPVKDVLTLEYSSDISSVRVVNMLGQEVLSRTFNATSAQVDMSQLAAGTYLVNVTSGDVQKTIKVVKQ